MSNPVSFQGSQCSPDVSRRPLDEQAWRAWQEKNRLHDARIAARLTKAVKWVCIATLLVTAALPLYIAPYQNALRFIVVAGAAMVTLQALRAHRYAFAALFAATGLLYNPVVPTFSLAGNWQVLIIYGTVIVFAVSLTWLNVATRGLLLFQTEAPDEIRSIGECMLSSMKAASWAFVAFGLLPASTPLRAEDLSSYRSFRIGTSLATVAAQVHMDPTKAQVFYERPALIQQFTWWPDNFAASAQTEAVKFVAFTFYNSELCRVFVIYDRSRTQGLSADDLIDSISAVYGNPSRPVVSVRTGGSVLYGFNHEEKVIARWQDLQSSVNLIRSSYDELYGLILISKRVDGLAQEAMIEGARLDVVERPQKEIDRRKREAEVERANAEKARVVNLPAFRP